LNRSDWFPCTNRPSKSWVGGRPRNSAASWGGSALKTSAKPRYEETIRGPAIWKSFTLWRPNGSLVFEELSDRRAARIAEYFDDADVSEVSRHDELIDWFFDAGDRLRKALQAVDLTV